MYLRFVVPDIDEDSCVARGVFHALHELRELGCLYWYEEEEHDRLREWFNEHLERPTRFTASKKPHQRKKNKAISWFKDSALEHLAHIRSMTVILEDHGIAVRTLTAVRVGYVVYEDQFQIVAEPFTDARI